ncbi:MAG: hypothetical protein OEZ13_13520 [Spirochaetia bacterium]|nr:hypothetical protein [Spirochaetia bacterium]
MKRIKKRFIYILSITLFFASCNNSEENSADQNTPAAVCGNSVLETGEDCDSGGVQTDTCKADCTFLADLEAVNYDAANLDISDITFTSPETETGVTQNFTVITAGDSGTTITWSSDNAAISFTDGTAAVTTPAEGNITVTITATIEKDGESAAKSFTIIVLDITPPAVSITTADTINNANKTNYSLSGDCSEEGLDVSVDVGGVVTTAVCTSGTYTVSSLDVSSLGDSASIPITADLTDAAGNSAPQASVNVLKDTIAPNSPTISGITAGSYNTNQSFTVTGSGETLEYSTNGGTSWNAYTTAVTLNTEGSYSVTAREIDAVGNVSATAMAINITIDKTNPTVEITSASTINNMNAANYSVGGACSEEGLSVSLNVGGVLGNANCAGGLYSTSGLDVSGVADNTALTITADISDAAGNSALQASVTVVKDTLAPAIVSAETMDVDGNGYIDHYKITFLENVIDSTFPGYVENSHGIANTWYILTGWPPADLLLAHGTSAPEVDFINDNILYLNFSEPEWKDTGWKPDIRSSFGLVMDNYNNFLGPVETLTITEADRAKPVVASAESTGETSIRVIFSEEVTAASAEVAANYSIPGLTINSAVMEGGAGVDGYSVILDTAVQTGIEYTVTVTGGSLIDMAGNTLNTINNSVTFIGFFVDFKVSAVGGDSQITITWTPTDMLNYNIYWSDTPGVTTDTVNKITGVTSPYTHIGLTNGTKYYYIITGDNGNGESKPSYEASGIAILYKGIFRYGKMSTEREQHTATLLNDGRVLVTGGRNSINGNLSSAEIYDPETNTFTSAGSMATTRQLHTATLLSDGRVFVAGGYYNSTAEIYDPATNTFTSAGSMSTWRCDHTATLLNDGRVLLAGGRGLSSAEIYDPTTNTFSTAASLSTVRKNHTATLLADGRVLLTGGYGRSSAEIYDPTTNTFSTAASMSTVRENHTATLLADGRVLVTGGMGSSDWLSSAEIYNPVTNTFMSAGSMSIAKGEHTATILSDGQVLVIGGHNGLFLDWNSLSIMEKYNPVTNTFTSVGNLSTPRGNHTATLLADGQVFVTGGLNNGNDVSDSELYNPETNAFTEAEILTAMRRYHKSTLLKDGRVLVTGGYDSGYQSTAETYNPTTNTFTIVGSMSIARAHHTSTLLKDGRVLLTGGYNGGSTSQSSAELYNPSTNTFSSAGSMSRVRSRHTATLLTDGRVLVTGGATNSAEIYNPVTNAFISAGTMSTSRSRHTATLLTDGRVLITGGNNGGSIGASSSYLTSAEIYDPATNVFISVGNMSQKRQYHTATLLVDGRVLVTGGEYYNGTYHESLSGADIFNPATNTFTSAGNMSTARAYHTSSLLADGRVLVTGGEGDLNPYYLSSAEIYEPATSTFTSAGNMVTLRSWHTATIIDDGKVVLIGGAFNAPFVSFELFE